MLFRHDSRRRYVVNLGGICNLTVLPAGATQQQVLGWDLGPCNLLLDGLVRRLFANVRVDDRGKLARQGVADGYLETALQARGLIHTGPQRSLGRENLDAAFFDWLNEQKPAHCNGHDVLASAVTAIARTIAMATAAAEGGEVVLAGGGVNNGALVDAIRAEADGHHRILLAEELGVPIQGREAAAFAVLGALCADGVPIGVEHITGSRGAGRAGCWVYP